MINIQPIDKKTVSDGSLLEVHSIFYTIQGEGPFAGHPAVFIRLAGCNLRCPGCDTDYTEGRRYATASAIVNAILALFPPSRPRYHKLVVITGGEPFRQNLTKLANALLAHDIHVQIETNGTLEAQGDFPFSRCTIVCSPKTGKIAIQKIDAYKYVIQRDSVDLDGLPIRALGHSASPHVARPPADFDGPIYVQAMDEKSIATELNIEAVRRIAMDHGYFLQLQIHKIIGVE